MSNVSDLAGWLASLSPLTLSIIVKATALLLVALLLSSAMRRASASARHAVWHLALVGLIVIPILARVMPGWTLPLPGALATLRLGGIVAPHTPPAAPAPSVGAITADEPAGVSHTVEKPPALQADGANALEASRPSWLDPEHVLSLIWAVGALAVLGWLLLGHLWLGRVARRSRVVSDGSWLRSVRELSDRMGLRRSVSVLRSDAAVIPATCGLFRPALLLPASADHWPEAQRSSVLCHELAHVKRLDCITQLVAQLACALFWFHPGAWYAARRLLVERELACDDMVLTLGTRPSDYASHLIEVARSLAPARLSVLATVSMARPSQLEGRLLAVLDPRRRRVGPLGSLGWIPAMAMLGIVLPLAAVEAGGTQLPPNDRTATVADSVKEAAAGGGSTAAEESAVVEQAKAPAPASLTLASAERRFRALASAEECVASAEHTLTLPVADARRAEVETHAGALFVVGRPGASDIRVFGIACATEVDDLDELRLVADRHRGSVELESRIGRHAHGAKLHILVELPVGMAVDVDDSRGDTEIRDVGRLRIEDGSGKLYVDGVRGSVRVEDGSDDIDIRDVDGSVRVTRDDGGDIRVASVSGDFEVSHRGDGLIDWLDVAGEIRVPSARD